jgi:DNA-binding transcriptional regulator LsrR (DeoR family)
MVARMHREEGLTQDAITGRPALFRSKVSRLMAQAREVGIVQFSVVKPDDLSLDGGKGTAGDIALPCCEADGICMESETNDSETSDRIIGTTLEQIRRVPKVVGVSGGPQKPAAIRAALKGRVTKVLITDSVTAPRLLDDA